MPRGSIHMTYYLQYGTTIIDRSLDRRVDTLRLEGQGRLKGWRMDFSRDPGQPNLVQDAKAQTWGLLYLIEKSMLPALDKEEAGGQRQTALVYFEGTETEAIFYTYPSTHPANSAANNQYLTQLRSAYDQASLPQAQIDQALGLAAKK